MDINKLNHFKNVHSFVTESSEFKEILLEKLKEEKYKDGELSLWKNVDPEAVHAWIMLVLKTKEIPTCYSYYRPSSAVAKVSGNSILFNRKFLNGLSSVRGASVILHERGHIQMGFNHDFYNTKRRANSLCYILNEVFEETAAMLGLENEIVTKKRKSFWDKFKFWRWF